MEKVKADEEEAEEPTSFHKEPFTVGIYDRHMSKI